MISYSRMRGLLTILAISDLVFLGYAPELEGLPAMNLGPNGVTQLLRDVISRGKPGDEGQQTSLAAMSSLAEPTRLAELLRSIHANPRQTVECAARSYLHPLGFHKLMLINESPLFELRIHAWRPSDVPGVDHVHNHRFGFVSSVICGGYDMLVFQADDAGTPMLEYCEAAHPGAGWRLERQGISGLRLLTNVRLRPGASYALAPEALHRVAVPAGVRCVTLLLRTTATGATTRVFVQQDEDVRTMIPMRAMSHEEYRCQLASVLAELSN